MQASFMYNETAATRKASIHDFFLANTMHDFLYSICGTKCGRFSFVQFYPESCYISCKTKAAGLPPIPLDVYLFPTQTARLPHGVFSTRICASNRSANADTWEIIPIMQFYPKSCYIHEKQSGRASTIPLNVYFFPTQTARLPHGVFSTRICASNRSANADT